LSYPRRSADLGRRLCHCFVEACEAFIPGAHGEMQGVAEVQVIKLTLVPPAVVPALPASRTPISATESIGSGRGGKMT